VTSLLSASLRRTLWIAPLLAASVSCSYEPVGGATIPSPLVAQVAGTWTGPVTLDGTTGVSAPLAGTLQCVGDALKAQSPTDTATLNISQTGADLSGRLTMQRSGLACSYSGTATAGSFVLSTPNVAAGTPNTCDAPEILVRCATGEVFQVEPIGTSITASVSSGVATGTLAQTYNVFFFRLDGTKVIVSGLNTSSTLSAVRR
jgi:hypothetical protein